MSLLNQQEVKESLLYQDEVEDVIFLSLTNKNIKNPKNIISAGINASSQIKTIIKFKEMNDIKTRFLNITIIMNLKYL